MSALARIIEDPLPRKPAQSTQRSVYRKAFSRLTALIADKMSALPGRSAYSLAPDPAPLEPVVSKIL
jgi:hypothetical protein